MMNQFKRLRKLQKAKVVESGAINRVVAKTGKSRPAVSRTLWGITKRPDPTVVAELAKEVEAILGVKLEDEAEHRHAA
jgi:hypothetical protein